MLLGGFSLVARAIVLAKPDNSLAGLAVFVGLFVLFDDVIASALRSATTTNSSQRRLLSRAR
jgi:hypothetical protein